ncbi:MAG: ComEC family competence protein [Rhizobiales bacterium]|nr:ComEC family competence protein [Hyphomicrobiales bacterium]
MVSGVWDEGREEAAAERGGMLRRVAEQQHGRTLLWSPCAIVTGIWVYFALPVEPRIWVASIATLIAAVLAFKAKGRGAMILIALVLAGFALAKFRTESIATIMLPANIGEVSVTGVVESKKASGAKRQTLVIALEKLAELPRELVPQRARVSQLLKHGDPPIGSRVRFRARIGPLPPPVMPGGFDFGRQLWFDGIGATGRMTGAIAIEDRDSGGWPRLGAAIAEVRKAIGARIAAVLEGDRAAIAEALVTGERGAISPAVNESLQISGLAHILSISGLHMSLVAGGMFWLARAILACFPSIALRHPIKKWAAVAALIVGFLYMGLAGADVATERSYIMIAIVFGAILFDRPAISMRNLAIAALIILVTRPEAALSAGFQMSFMAVMGLAALYEAWGERMAKQDEDAVPRTAAHRLLRRGVYIVVASLATTLVAGTFSAIPATYHFGRLSLYGVIANGLALPAVSLVVMPMALIAVLLMPLGLEGLPLLLMGEGLGRVTDISNWVASLPGAGAMVEHKPAYVAMTAAVGAAILCLLRGRMRYAGLALIAAAPLLGLLDRPPDILVERTAGAVAIRSEVGELVPVPQSRGRYAVKKWLEAAGDPPRQPRPRSEACGPAKAEAAARHRRAGRSPISGRARALSPIAAALIS